MSIWNCREGCGECCGTVPIEYTVYNNAMHADLRQVACIEYFDGITDGKSGKKYVLARTQDGFCIFLHRETKRCVIYQDRPDVCRMYGRIPELLCPYIRLNGQMRSEKEIVKTHEKINTHIDEMMKKIQPRIQEGVSP